MYLAEEMSDMPGMHEMGGTPDPGSTMSDMSTGIDWFPPWLTIIVSILLAAVALHHVPCVVRGHGNRWFHLAHIAMSLSMIYMYLIMSFRPSESWGPTVSRVQMWFFVATSAAILAYLVSLLIRRRGFSLLWLLLLGQQAGMIYMWLPMKWWSGLLTLVVTVWFVVEAIGWLADIFRDYQVVPPGIEATAMHCHTAGSDAYVAPGWADRIGMAVMAASMAYMFLGMQAMAGFAFS